MRIISKSKVRVGVERLRQTGYSLAKAIQLAATEFGIEEEAVHEALKNEDDLNELEAA